MTTKGQPDQEHAIAPVQRMRSSDVVLESTCTIREDHGRRENPFQPLCSSVFKAADSAAEPAFYVLPHPLDYSRVVVAVGEITVQRGKAVLLAGLLHSVELVAVKCELVDIAPIVGGGIHGETWRNGSIRANEHVVLAGAEADCECLRRCETWWQQWPLSGFLRIVWIVCAQTNSNKTFLALIPCFNDPGRRDTLRAMSPGFDLPIALLRSQSSCAAASRGALCRNPGSRRKRVQLDHDAAMSCVDERNQTSKQESISTSS